MSWREVTGKLQRFRRAPVATLLALDGRAAPAAHANLGTHEVESWSNNDAPLVTTKKSTAMVLLQLIQQPPRHRQNQRGGLPLVTYPQVNLPVAQQQQLSTADLQDAESFFLRQLARTLPTSPLPSPWPPPRSPPTSRAAAPPPVRALPSAQRLPPAVRSLRRYEQQAGASTATYSYRSLASPLHSAVSGVSNSPSGDPILHRIRWSSADARRAALEHSLAEKDREDQEASWIGSSWMEAKSWILNDEIEEAAPPAVEPKRPAPAPAPEEEPCCCCCCCGPQRGLCAWLSGLLLGGAPSAARNRSDGEEHHALSV